MNKEKVLNLWKELEKEIFGYVVITLDELKANPGKYLVVK